MSNIAKGKTTATVKTGKQGLARVTGGKGTATRTVGLPKAWGRIREQAGLSCLNNEGITRSEISTSTNLVWK